MAAVHEMRAPIPVRELERMLLDPDTPDAEIRPYLRMDTTDTQPFEPEVRINPNLIEEAREEAAIALGSLNGVARWRRQLRYRRKIAGWRGLRIVSEGDSWFQFPFLLEDVIDQIFDEYAVFDLGAAGDLLGDMVKQDELSAAIAAEKPHVVLLSGGGNDLLGGGRLMQYLHPFDAARDPDDYLRPEFDALLRTVMGEYRFILSRIRAASREARAICHGYDHALPNSGRWLGRPMASLGIHDPSLQAAIIKVIVDRFYVALEVLVDDAEWGGMATLVNCRGAVGRSQWWDELHPTDDGFRRVAARFREAISEAGEESIALSGHAAGVSARLEGAEAGLALPNAQAAQNARMLAAGYSEEELFAEIGRRAELVRIQPEAAGFPVLELASSSAEGAFDGFGELGRRIVGRVHRELFGMLCGGSDADRKDGAALRDALGLGDAAVAAALVSLLTGGLGMAPAIATAVAAIFMKRLLKPSWEETCSFWREKLADGDQVAGRS